MGKVEKIAGGMHPLRVTRRKGRVLSPTRSTSARVRVKCGCCKETVDIYHDENLDDPRHNMLEINGVMGTIAQWREVLGPLLGFREVRHSTNGVLTVTWESRID